MKIPEIGDTQHENTERVNKVCKRVITELKGYSNYNSLTAQEREKIEGAIRAMSVLFLEIDPGTDEEKLFNTVGDAFFTILNIKVRTQDDISDNRN